MPKSHEVTMAEVARAAGVSLATVSRVLSNAPGVGAATRERVRREAERLSYVVSPEASGLARGTTRRVAVLVPRVTRWFHGSMLETIESELRAEAIDVLIYQVEHPELRARFFTELPARRKVDAVLLIALPLDEREAERLADLNVHVVVAGGQIQHYPYVKIDDQAAARTAVSHLISLGHERIAMITVDEPSSLYWSSTADRLQGYTDSLAAAGLEARPEYVVRLPYGIEAGCEGVSRLLRLAEPPTAVVTYSDEMALGALRELQRSGVHVPDEMSLASFDGHPIAKVFGITTIDQHVTEQAQVAAQMTIDLMARKSVKPAVMVRTELAVRESTAAPSRI
ncbi:LacI family DNA-binding transcriptional regulator [Hoyosella subflava]|nr:LacI family DNA-binding transcriptional regulator [Hoyosella subflava]